MTMVASGAISANDIALEFGGTTPHAINEYYRSGGLVPNSGTNAAVPTSGQISFNQFYSTSNVTFTPVSHTYTTGTAASETVPTGASFVTITVDGGGGGGGRSTAIGTFDSQGGGGSGRTVLTARPVLSGEWGTALTYTVGAGGVGQTVAGGVPTAGANSTVTGTLNGSAISLNGNGGVAGGTGGGASGGTTNTSGGTGTAGNGINSSGTGGAGAGGGAGGTSATRGAGGGGSYTAGSVGAGNGGAGAGGRIIFDWT